MLGSPRNSGGVERRDLIEETLTRSVIGAFFEVYNYLGFGFLEHLYVMALDRELLARGHRVAREVWVRVTYKGDELGIQRVDMIVDEKLVVETKASSNLHDFGPKASFRREICLNRRSNPPNPFNPPNPPNPPS